MCKSNKKGFTFVELIVATVILSIAVAGVYAAFLSATKFVGFFRHEVMAVSSAHGYLDQQLAVNNFDDIETEFTQPDPSTWPLNSEVEALDNTSSEVATGAAADLGSTSNGYGFKKIDIIVQWDEREL